MTDKITPAVPPDVLDAMVRAVAQARFLAYWPDADEDRVCRHVDEVVLDGPSPELAIAAPIIYAAGVAAGRKQAAAEMCALADRIDERADGGDNPSDCLAMAHFADDLRRIAEESNHAD